MKKEELIKKLKEKINKAETRAQNWTREMNVINNQFSEEYILANELAQWFKGQVFALRLLMLELNNEDKESK